MANEADSNSPSPQNLSTPESSDDCRTPDERDGAKTSVPCGENDSSSNLKPPSRVDDSESPETPSPPNNPPTAQDWKSYRDIFTKIYRNQGHTLKEAKAIMIARFGFDARLEIQYQGCRFNS
jgi:Clr5 domain